VPRKLRQLRADLRRPGFVPDHQTGSHQVWKHELLPGLSANLAGRDGAAQVGSSTRGRCMSDLQYSMLTEWSNDDQAYLVTLPEWAERVLGPVTHGETYEEAVQRGKEALVALIASSRKHGEPLPVPQTYAREHRAS
jgi:predicted RNase H-like HicB family nuclease